MEEAVDTEMRRLILVETEENPDGQDYLQLLRWMLKHPASDAVSRAARMSLRPS